MIICNIIVIPNKKPRFQKELIWRGQGYEREMIDNECETGWKNEDDAQEWMVSRWVMSVRKMKWEPAGRAQ